MALVPWLIGGALTALAAVGIGGTVENRRLSVRHDTVYLNTLPAELDGFRLVHLSDLHATSFGHEQSRLVEAVLAQKPDAVVITGDLIDRRRTHTETGMKPALDLLTRLSEAVPTVFCDGNHEPMSTCGDRFHALAEHTGAVNVTGRYHRLTANGESFTVVGIPDTATVGFDTDRWQEGLFHLCDPLRGTPHVVLSHRPHHVDAYRKLGHTLVLSGHAHGGQWRLPLLGGLFAPDQGILPRYTEGRHTLGDTTMIISRGLGNSGFPLRLFNPPEIVVLTLAAPPKHVP